MFDILPEDSWALVSTDSRQDRAAPTTDSHSGRVSGSLIQRQGETGGEILYKYFIFLQPPIGRVLILNYKDFF